MKPIRLDLVAYKRVPLGGAPGDQDIILMGLDWSAATYSMQVRPAAGDTSTPYVNLSNAAAGSEGISASYNSGYVSPVTSTVVGATTIRPQINQATLAAIPLTSDDPSQPAVLAYDIKVTPSGGQAQVFLYGTFTLYPGVTI